MNKFRELTSQIVSLVDPNNEETSKNFLPLKNSKNLIACSGGADSIALALIAVNEGLDFALVYVEHNINKSTRACEDIVKDLSEKLDVEFFVKHVYLEIDKTMSNIEARARDARYIALEQVRKENKFDFVLTAHHLDDYVETFLINLMRGAGSSVASLSSKRQNIVRPILHFRKNQLENIVEKSDIEYFSDPSNDSDSFVRNRVRKELIPLMDEISNRDVSPLISKAGQHISRDQKFISTLGAQSWPIDDDTSTISLQKLNPAIQNHAIRSWLMGDMPSTKELTNILAVVNHKITKTQISGDRTIWRKDAMLYQSQTSKLLEENK